MLRILKNRAAILCGLILATTLLVLYAQERAPKTAGGDIIPLRQVSDPYPVFNGLAIDPENDLVAMSDVNRKSLLSYARSADSKRGDITAPRRQVFGPRTNVGFVAGILLDSQRKEILALNNDIEDTMVVMPYDAQGNETPKRMLSVPHQAWGLAMSRKHGEVAITIELQEAVVIYKREARNVEAPMRVIRGPNAGLADPHGIFWDDAHNEIGVANHGNYRGLMKDEGAGCVPVLDARGRTAEPESGAVLPPSITTYSGDGRGDAKPLRTIQGEKTRLDFPMGLGDDPVHDEFAVANNGDNSVLVFSRTASGNVAPIRVLTGAKTGINRPMGVAIDAVNNELWVSNFIDHTALVFDRKANGNAAPRRIIRTAPPGTPSPGFGNPQAVAYDSKRDQILVPNCVAQPRIAAFARVANGTTAPERVITGSATKLSRTVHGIAYDPVRDEIYVTNALADAVLVFRAGANGAEPPVRTIQGPCTGLVNPHAVSLDLEHREILVSSLSARALAIFPMEANGNVTPRRYIQGPKTRLGHTVGMGVDAETNVLVVANAEDLLFFDRLATGDVAPLGEIKGERTGIRDEPWELQVHNGKIFLAASNHLHVNVYTQVTLRPEYSDGQAKVPEDPWLNPELGFIGVWNVRDRGDVPPRAKIGGPFSQLAHPTGLALNPNNGEIYVTDSVRNALFSFLVPDLLQ